MFYTWSWYMYYVYIPSKRKLVSSTKAQEVTMSKQANIIAGKLEYKQFIQLEDGTEVQVRYNQNPDLYTGTDVQLYSYEASEGTGTERVKVTRYAVAVNDALRAKRVSLPETVNALIAQGLTADEIVAKLKGNN